MPGPSFITVAPVWAEHAGAQTRYTRHGFATYRLTLRLPEEPKHLMLKIGKVYTAQRLLLDEGVATTAAIVGEIKAATQPDIQPRGGPPRAGNTP